jgi:hypothetical protein
MTPDTLSPHDPLQTFSALHISTTPSTTNTNSSSSTSVSTSTLSRSPSPIQHHHISQRVRFKASPFYITHSNKLITPSPTITNPSTNHSAVLITPNATNLDHYSDNDETWLHRPPPSR